jgi:hypothetical protein
MKHPARPQPPKSKTPQPAPKGVIPTQEEFEVWCEHPITRFVATSHANMALEAKNAWIAMTWGRESVDADTICDALLVLQAKAETFRAFLDATWLDHLKAVDPKSWKEELAP